MPTLRCQLEHRKLITMSTAKTPRITSKAQVATKFINRQSQMKRKITNSIKFK